MGRKLLFRKILISLLNLFFVLSLDAQVNGVKYMVKYNKQKFVYDCYLHITSGSATSSVQRTQFNAQFTLVTPADAKLIVTQSYMPLRNNFNYDGQEPMIWNMTSFITAGNYSYFSMVPTLSPTSRYNNLATGDSVKLFSVKLDKNYCGNEVRMYDIAIDDQPGFENGFTIGGISQVYKGNIVRPNNNKASIAMPSIGLCVGSISQISPTIPPNFIFESSDSSIIDIAQGPIFIGRKAGKCDLTITDTMTGCRTLLLNNRVVAPPQIAIDDDEINVGETIFVQPSTNVTWTSSNPAVATVTNSGIITGISSGKTTLTCTEEGSFCPSNVSITVLSTSNIDENELSDIKVFPTVISDKVNVLGPGIQELTLYNQLGQIVQQIGDKFDKSPFEFNMEELKSGIYFLLVKSDNKFKMNKLIKK